MKTAIVLGFVAVTLGTFLIWQSKQEDRYCIEQWLTQTKDLLEGTADLFSGIAGANKEQEDATVSNKANEATDDKLQALLPVSGTQEIDWQLKESQLAVDSGPESSESMLPNLFNKSVEPKTRFGGQLHLDESDNIVGAEVNMHIPTN